jgi:hypothetical protein
LGGLDVIRYPVVVISLYLLGAVAFGTTRVVADWGEDIGHFELATDAVETGLEWPVTVIKWLGLL